MIPIDIFYKFKLKDLDLNYLKKTLPFIHSSHLKKHHWLASDSTNTKFVMLNQISHPYLNNYGRIKYQSQYQIY